MKDSQLPESIAELAQQLRLLSGVGRRSSEKLALDIVQLHQEDFESFTQAIDTAKKRIAFCPQCGFFTQRLPGDQDKGQLCSICSDNSRDETQICVCEKPTDVLTMEKGGMFRGHYHVLEHVISPLDNIFVQDTQLPALLDERIPKLLEKHSSIELILFLRAGFGTEATISYIKETIHKTHQDKVTISRLAQGLPLSFNPDTLDSQTMIKALEDRRSV